LTIEEVHCQIFFSPFVFYLCAWLLSMVRQVSSLSEFDKVLREAGSKLVVIDFFAQWCGPCHFIAPFVENLATKYPQVVFVKVDVDQASDVASTCGISAMPTFHFYKNNQKVKALDCWLFGPTLFHLLFMFRWTK